MPPVKFEFNERSLIRCPKCKSVLKRVRNESLLNAEQFDSVKAGDWYCETCPDNGRGKSKLCYWWNAELGISLSPESMP